ncbi:MAG: hypothetical protein B5M56_04675 [Desulfococcus sp. 4484_241]|nr:MAG: hypothetical protein B5M56_04675 [Desulfococcus sp. 4484_241]
MKKKGTVDPQTSQNLLGPGIREMSIPPPLTCIGKVTPLTPFAVRQPQAGTAGHALLGAFPSLCKKKYGPPAY